MIKIPNELKYGTEPDKTILDKVKNEINQSDISFLTKRAHTCANEIYWIKNDNQRFKEIFQHIYYYLLFYTKCYNTFIETTTNANKLILLQHEKEELERNFKMLSQKYNRLLNQTSNMFTGEDVKMLQQTLEQVKGNLIYEQNQRANAEEKLEKLKEQHANLLKRINDLQNELEEKKTFNNSAELNALQQENKELKSAYEELNSRYINLWMQSEF